MEHAANMETTVLNGTKQKSHPSELKRGSDLEPANVTLNLATDWFRVKNIQKKKPSQRSVKRFWRVLRRPWNNHNAMTFLNSIKGTFGRAEDGCCYCKIGAERLRG